MKQIIITGIDDNIKSRFKANCNKKGKTMREVLLKIIECIADGKKLHVTGDDPELK